MDRAWSTRSPSSTRYTASSTSTTATCWGSSTAPRTPRDRLRPQPSPSARRTPISAGASYVIVQKYLHDLTAWNALSVEEQERLIGRPKLSNVELPDEVKPSQLPRRAQHDHRTRRRPASDPARQHGLRNGREARRVRHLLHRLRGHAERDRGDARNMFLGKPPGNHDRILDFSTAVTGTSSSCRPPTSSRFISPPRPPPAAVHHPAGGGERAGRLLPQRSPPSKTRSQGGTIADQQPA